MAWGVDFPNLLLIFDQTLYELVQFVGSTMDVWTLLLSLETIRQVASMRFSFAFGVGNSAGSLVVTSQSFLVWSSQIILDFQM